MRRASLLIPLLAAWAHAGQPFATADWWQWRDIASPRINADGTAVVYVETWNRREDDRFCGNLWTVPANGGAPRRLTEGAWRDALPVWSPDGARIAYLSDRGGTPQIRVRRLDGAADIEVTRGDASPLTVAWSPDGKWLAYTARVTAKPDAAWASPALLPFIRKAAARVQLFVIAAGGGSPRALPLGDLEIHGEPAWMPDGQAILVAAAPVADASNILQGGEIYAVNVQSGERRPLTKHEGRDEVPVPSPDGSRIAWISREPKAQSYQTGKLNVSNPDGSRARTLAGTLDRDVVLPQWSNDSRTVYFLADDRGATRLYAARNDGSVRPVLSDAQRLRDFSLADNGRAAAVRTTAAGSAELIIFPVDLPEKPVQVAAANSALLAARDRGTVEPVEWASEGKTIQGWVVRPPGFDPAKKYPLLVDVDDAPRRMCGGEFRLRAQVFAARGFLVLCANPRGTPGYGEEFGNLLRSRFPGDDADDILRGVEQLIAKGGADPARLSIVGGMVAAWAIGHSNRFARAVIRHGVADWLTDVAHAPDGLYRAAAWMGAMPWDDPEQYVKHSPVYFAGNIKAGTLILSEGDPGAEELYFALRARKLESALVDLGAPRPSREILEWEATLNWLEQPVR
ncbi:MAG: prolyl oligopeptidase family serine peptidase [Candidatus Solibacter sp.]